MFAGFTQGRAMQIDVTFTLASIALIQFLGWLSPGPNLLAIVSASTLNGRKSGVLTALGLAAGVGVWASLTVAGVAVLFELFPQVFVLLRIAGALYLIWLGIKSWRAALSGNRSSLTLRSSAPDGWRAFRTGFIVVATNPKAVIFFGSVVTAFVPAQSPPWLLVAIVAEFTVLSAVLNSFTAVVFSTDVVVRKFQAAQKQISALFGTVFVGLGLVVAQDVYQSLRRLGQ